MSEEDSQGVAVYKRLLSYTKRHWVFLAIAIVAMFFQAGAEPAFAWLLKILIDGSFVEQDPEIQKLAPLLIVLIFAARGRGHGYGYGSGDGYGYNGYDGRGYNGYAPYGYAPAAMTEEQIKEQQAAFEAHQKQMQEHHAKMEEQRKAAFEAHQKQMQEWAKNQPAFEEPAFPAPAFERPAFDAPVARGPEAMPFEQREKEMEDYHKQMEAYFDKRQQEREAEMKKFEEEFEAAIKAREAEIEKRRKAFEDRVATAEPTETQK